MKNKLQFKIFYKVFILLVILFYSCSQPGESPEEYDSRISTAFEIFNNEFMSYSMKLRNSSSDENEESRVKLLQSAKIFKDSAGVMKPFENDESYLNSYKNFLNTISYCLTSYDSIKINLGRKDSMLTSDEAKIIKELTGKSLLASDKAYLEFQNTQKKFREKNKINPK
jgi:hypothetical protein